jgi:integrase
MPLELKRRHGSPFWYIRGTVRGQSVDESTKTSDREAAEALRSKREWELTQGSIFGRRAVATFLEAAVSYMEAGGERRFLEPVINKIGARPLAKIGQSDIDRLAKTLYPGASASTINRQLYTPVSSVLRHGHKRGLCELSVLERPRQPKGKVRWLTPEEAARLIGACAPHLGPLVTFLFYTGARVSEALSLDWRDVDLNRWHVAFHDTKNGESRGVPQHAEAVVALANLPHKSGPVFRRPDGHPYRAKDDGGGQIKTGFRAACRRAGIKNFTPHDCRHTWATWHYAANRDLAGLMELGGWRSERMVLRYAHINKAQLAPGIANLPSLGGDQMGTSVSQTKKAQAKQ